MAKKSKHHFCSSSCYGEWQKVHRVGVGRKRITVTCYTCGKEFEKQPCAVTVHNFCSRKCFNEWRSSDDWSGENNPAWLGGHLSYRGPNWNQQSQAAKERDQYTCQRCGSKEDLHVHHITPFHLFDDYREANRLDNLITLCNRCHRQSEYEFWKGHPELLKGRRWPNVQLIKECSKCGEEFIARSPNTQICDECCTFTCENCGKKFVSRKLDRRPKYCSRECRSEHIRPASKRCKGCGQIFHPVVSTRQYCSQRCRLVNDPPRRGVSRRKTSAQE